MTARQTIRQTFANTTDRQGYLDLQLQLEPLVDGLVQSHYHGIHVTWADGSVAYIRSIERACQYLDAPVTAMEVDYQSSSHEAADSVYCAESMRRILTAKSLAAWINATRRRHKALRAKAFASKTASK